MCFTCIYWTGVDSVYRANCEYSKYSRSFHFKQPTKMARTPWFLIKKLPYFQTKLFENHSLHSDTCRIVYILCIPVPPGTTWLSRHLWGGMKYELPKLACMKGYLKLCLELVIHSLDCRNVTFCNWNTKFMLFKCVSSFLLFFSVTQNYKNTQLSFIPRSKSKI